MTSTLTPPDRVPELPLSQRIDAVPERVTLALDAKVLEKQLLTELVGQWLQALRPEMERMAQEIVERSAQAYWRQHAGTASAGISLAEPKTF